MAVFKWKLGETTFEEKFDETKEHELTKDEKRNEPVISPSRKDDFEPNENKDKKKPNEDDLPLEEGLPSIGECIFGFHTMALVAETLRNNDYNLEETIAMDLTPAFQFVNGVKKLIVDMYKYQTKFISNSEDAHLASEVNSFINACRTNIINRTGINRNAIQEEYPLLFEKQGEIIEISQEIINHVAAAQNNLELKQPLELYERLAVKVLPDITTQRRRLVRQIAFVHKYHPSKNEPYVCQLILDDDAFKEYIQPKMALVANACSDIGTHFLNIDSISNPDFANVVDALGRCINSGSNGRDDGGSNPLDDFTGDNCRCYGLLQNGADKLISFSGIRDANDPTITGYLKFKQKTINEWKKLEKCINDIVLADNLLSGFKYAELNLDVISNDPQKESLDTAIKSCCKEIGKRYACCERKMISKTKPSATEKCLVFTRHIPCHDCGVSLSEFKLNALAVKVYYLNRHKKKSRDRKINEYHVK